MSDQELEVVARWREGQSQRRISRELGISRDRVSRILRDHEQQRSDGVPHPDLPSPKSHRKSQLDEFQASIEQLLAQYPNITATRVFEELKLQGYQGGYTMVKVRVRELRPRPAPQPVVRFETAAGKQAQMDYAIYQIDFTCEGKRKVNLFSYVLSYSRRQYIRFTESQDFETTIAEHVSAFKHLQGIPSSCLYDNMKTVVQRWEDDHPVYNTRFLSFATHYGFRPSACRPRRPQTKGKVERPFYFIETNLLNGRTFRSLEHLNEVARWWLESVADVRVHRETKKRPIDAHAEEIPHLMPLPEQHYDTAKVVYRMVSLEHRIKYRQNEYSVPWQQIGQLLPVRVTNDHLFIYDQHLNVIAQHAVLSQHVTSQKQDDPSHRPPPKERQKLEWIESKYAELGDVGTAFLNGLLEKQRYGRHQSQQILMLRRMYQREDILAAMERAIRYHAYSRSALERILATQATPRENWCQLTDDQEQLLQDLGDSVTSPRPTSDYQHLLSPIEDSDNAAKEDTEGDVGHEGL